MNLLINKDVLSSLRQLDDASVKLLVVSAPIDEIQTRSQQMEILQEAMRVIEEDGDFVSDGPLAEFLLNVMNDESDDYVPFIGEVLEIMGRSDVDTGQFEGEADASEL